MKVRELVQKIGKDYDTVSVESNYGAIYAGPMHEYSMNPNVNFYKSMFDESDYDYEYIGRREVINFNDKVFDNGIKCLMICVR